MDVNRTQRKSDLLQYAPAERLWPLPWARLGMWLGRALLILAVLAGLGRSAPAGAEMRAQRLTVAVAGYTFDLTSWTIGAVWEKAGHLARNPAAPVPPADRSPLVVAYLANARRMAGVEWEINRLLAGAQAEDPEIQARIAALQAEEVALRRVQAANRPAVEQIIQEQVAAELEAAGFALAGITLPPVQFTFTEPPKKMVVSPRSRIQTVYTRMLTPEMELPTIQEREAAIQAQEDLAVYITNIGGLGAYPTLVVERAPLAWVLSTVAHEWVHNYLAFFPLGWNYFASAEATTINETVADIVGDEIGDRVLRRYYPDHVPPAADPPSPIPIPIPNPQSPIPNPPFDFRAEMRATRLEVDRLLAEGKVVEAEAYMAARRLIFVENDHNLRVLNQAYFAFHGSYATGAASSSPIGPLLQSLRNQMPDLRSFLLAVRTIKSQAEIEEMIN